jgi:hypothetical protein
MVLEVTIAGCSWRPGKLYGRGSGLRSWRFFISDDYVARATTNQEGNY